MPMMTDRRHSCGGHFFKTRLPPFLPSGCFPIIRRLSQPREPVESLCRNKSSGKGTGGPFKTGGSPDRAVPCRSFDLSKQHGIPQPDRSLCRWFRTFRLCSVSFPCDLPRQGQTAILLIRPALSFRSVEIQAWDG